MPQDMTISKVGDGANGLKAPNKWDGQHGPMVTYQLELEGHGPAQLNQKPETPAPTVGQSVFGDLEPGDPRFPPKLKKAQKQGGFNGGRQGVSPEQQRSIERQVSAKIGAGALFGIERDSSKDDVRDWGNKLRWLTDEVHAAIEGK